MNGQYGMVHLPTLTRINKIYIISSAVLFVLQFIVVQVTGLPIIEQGLGLSAAGVSQGYLFQLVSYPLVGNGLIGVIFSSLILWFIGSELEKMWGFKRYLIFSLVTVIGSGLIYLLICRLFFSQSLVLGLPLVGFTGLCNAILVAYAILFPDKIFTFMLIFPMRAKYFCLLLLGMLLFMGFSSPSKNLVWGHLGAILCGVAYMVMVSSSRYKKFKEFVGRQQKMRKRSHLSVIDGDRKQDEKDGPKYWQ